MLCDCLCVFRCGGPHLQMSVLPKLLNGANGALRPLSALLHPQDPIATRSRGSINSFDPVAVSPPLPPPSTNILRTNRLSVRTVTKIEPRSKARLRGNRSQGCYCSNWRQHIFNDLTPQSGRVCHSQSTGAKKKRIIQKTSQILRSIDRSFCSVDRLDCNG